MSHPAKGRGFTLLELLVVLFIIGIVTAMATLSIGTATSGKGVEQTADQLAGQLTLVREEASIQGREFGLTFFTDRYAFSTFDFENGRWQELGDDAEALRPQLLPGESVLELELDGRSVVLASGPTPAVTERSNDEKEKDKAEDPPARRIYRPADDRQAPQVLILSSGDVTPFTLHLRPAIGTPGLRLIVSADGTTQTVRDER